MRYLIDTGILLRLFDSSDPNHAAIRDALRLLRARGHELVTCPQNIAEFWNVSTRPPSARGGFGQEIEVTNRRVEFIERYGSILAESRMLYHEWRKLVVEYQIKGVAVHDARLVAAMMAGNISGILTLNVSDFSRYAGIDAMTAEDVLRSLG